MKLSEKQSVLVEKMGVFNEQSGMSPVEARILALLLICDAVELSFDEIRELLSISKSATSNALNILLKTNKIQYATKLGDRKRYFSCKINNWETDLNALIQVLSVKNNLFKEVLAARSPKTKEFNKNFKEVINFMDFLEVELSSAIKKWSNK